MSDWQVFIDSVPWFLQADADVRVSHDNSGLSLPTSVADVYPSLSRLLAQAAITNVSVDDVAYQLFAWDSTDRNRIGWLCFPESQQVPTGLHEDHAELLQSFGGIVERFNEPEDTWLLNHDDALTCSEASHDASFLEDYMWAFEDAGLTLPIVPTDYYSIAREANGNTTLCHRLSGQVVLFAPDHSFDFVMPLDGCPDYTLYKIDGIVTIRDWVNAVADQWLAHIATPA